MVFVLHCGHLADISNYQRHCVDPRGHWHGEQRCKYKEVQFCSVNLLFIGCVCQRNSRSSFTSAEHYWHTESWHDICGAEQKLWIWSWNMFTASEHKFPFPYLQSIVWSSNLWPISVWNIFICESLSALLMNLRGAQGGNLVVEIHAPQYNWYPTGYYGYLLIGRWSVAKLIVWKVELCD